MTPTPLALPLTPLGQSDLHVTPIGLGTMTFGEQVSPEQAYQILDHAVELGINLIDTAEMYSVPPRAQTCGMTERIIGQWLAQRPHLRQRLVLATKVAGPGRNMPWIRADSTQLTRADVIKACEGSLRRLHTDVIDLYQIHWPNRAAVNFGAMYFDPQQAPSPDMMATADIQDSVHEQLQALAQLVQAGKVRYIGLSNETPWGVAEFLRCAQAHNLPRIVSVQNPYGLLNRCVDNGLDEVLYHERISLLAYSPLAFGALTGKYDAQGLKSSPDTGRLARFDTMQRQRWARPEALHAAQQYNALAGQFGLSPTQMALAFCYTSWRVTSTLIGVTSVDQLDQNLQAWGTTLPESLLAAIDQLRWQYRDPAQ